MEMSKTKFKAHALEVFRNVEQSGDTIIITDHGKPKSVVKYESATSPVSVDDWDNA